MHEGKVTITVSVAFEESINNVKKGSSFKSTSTFETLEGLHEKADVDSQKLLKDLKNDLPAKFSQPKLTDKPKLEEEATA